MVQITKHVIWLVCVLTIIQEKEAHPCSPEQYYETGLKECFYCTDLCTKAKARDQVSECQEKCPVINIKPHVVNPCSPEQYYDIGLKECFYCTDLCHNAKARDQLSECQEKCPDYVESSSPSTTTSRTNSNDTTIQLTPETKMEDHDNIVIVACVIGVAIWIMVFCTFRYAKRQRDDSGNVQHQVDPENPHTDCPQQNCQSSGIQDTQPPMSSSFRPLPNGD